MRWMTLSIDPVVTRNGNDHEEYSYLTIPSQRCHVWPINEYSGFRFRYCMQGWVMRFSIHVWVFMFGYSCLGIHVWVFMFGYSYLGSEFWSGIEVQVFIFRFRFLVRYWGSGIEVQACRFSIQVWLFRSSIQVQH